MSSLATMSLELRYKYEQDVDDIRPDIEIEIVDIIHEICDKALFIVNQVKDPREFDPEIQLRIKMNIVEAASKLITTKECAYLSFIQRNEFINLVQSLLADFT